MANPPVRTELMNRHGKDRAAVKNIGLNIKFRAFQIIKEVQTILTSLNVTLQGKLNKLSMN